MCIYIHICRMYRRARKQGQVHGSGYVSVCAGAIVCLGPMMVLFVHWAVAGLSMLMKTELANAGKADGRFARAN